MNKNRIRHLFAKRFFQLIMIESIFRTIITFSFEDKVYTVIILGVFLTYILLYITYVRKKLKQISFVTFLFSLYFITHYSYILNAVQIIPAIYFWFVPLPIAVRIYYSNRIFITVFIVLGLLLLLAPNITLELELISHYKNIIQNKYELPTISFVVNSFLVIILCNILVSFYYLLLLLSKDYGRLQIYMLPIAKFLKMNYLLEESSDIIDNRIKTNNTASVDKSDNNKEIDCDSDPTTNSIREIKYCDICKLILNHLEESKNYMNQGYTIQQLADELETNKNAISVALNRTGNITFKDLINKYRINEVKRLFETDTYWQENMKLISLKVGFAQRATFNRIFKKETGMTPTEYIVQLKLRNKQTDIIIRDNQE